MSDCIEAAKRGAEWLDTIVPEWHNCVNPDSLDLSTWSTCVIGQLCKLGCLDKSNIPGPPPAPPNSTFLTWEYNGFICGLGRSEQLNHCWRKLIDERRVNTSPQAQMALAVSELAAEPGP